MDFHLLSDVRQRDGGKLGELRHVVYDPEMRRVVSLVVQQTGLDGASLIVPIEPVVESDDDGVYLTLTVEQFDALEPYAYGRNIAPPPADVADEISSSDYEQEPADVPDVPPIGAASGITTIAFTPIVEVLRNIPDGAITIDDQSIVSATDGDIGRVEHVLMEDETKKIRGFIVETGSVVTHSWEIPMAWVRSIQPGAVLLNVDLNTVSGRS